MILKMARSMLWLTLEITMITKNGKNKYKNFPSTPGVYLMKNANNSVIYVGKAGSLKKRVASYFTKAHNAKTAALVSHIASIKYIETETILDATFKEAELIKKYQPKYNVDQKDDKSFMFVVITKEEFPKVLLARGRELDMPKNKRTPRFCRAAKKLSLRGGNRRRSNTINKQQRNCFANASNDKTQNIYRAVFGPFANAELIRSLLKLVRRIIPFSNCNPAKSGGTSRSILAKKVSPCFYYHLNQCPGICTGEIRAAEYQKIIRNLILFFQGKKKRVVVNLKKEMARLTNAERFEEAAKIRNQLFNLAHIQDISLLKRGEDQNSVGRFQRIEGYDISNISGENAAGSMVVFENGKPVKNEYRKFKIKTVKSANDTAMLKEILNRRFAHREWRAPNLILIDGGVSQVRAAESALRGFKMRIPIVGIAKGRKRKKNEFIVSHLPKTVSDQITPIHNLLIRARDEAHRFANLYHRILRDR